MSSKRKAPASRPPPKQLKGQPVIRSIPSGSAWSLSTLARVNVQPPVTDSEKLEAVLSPLALPVCCVFLSFTSSRLICVSKNKTLIKTLDSVKVMRRTINITDLVRDLRCIPKSPLEAHTFLRYLRDLLLFPTQETYCTRLLGLLLQWAFCDTRFDVEHGHLFYTLHVLQDLSNSSESSGRLAPGGRTRRFGHSRLL